jgi:NADH-quinone oxidoreductase subunit A
VFEACSLQHDINKEFSVNNWLLLPPIAFIIVLGFSLLVAFLSKRLACKTTDHPAGKYKAYACGEDFPCHRLQPDYSQFFPFAFFFTIMHVLVLIITTVPAAAIRTSGVAVLYIIAAAAGLAILFRR